MSVYLKSWYDKNEKENNKYPNKKLKELVEKRFEIYSRKFSIFHSGDFYR
jgi:hypothetical protein